MKQVSILQENYPLNPIRWTEKQSLVFLFPLIISISFAMDVFVPAIPMMSHFFQTDDRIMQASLYLFMLTVAIGQLFVGPVADYIGRRRITLYAALLFFLGSTLSAFSTNLPALLSGRMIQAIGACGTYLLCFIIIRDNFSTKACARLFSVLAGINSMIASSAPVIGGILLDLTHDWRSGFYFLMLLGLLMSLMAWRNIPDYDFPKPEKMGLGKLANAKQILNHRGFRQYVFIASVSLLGLYLFCAISPGILISKLKLSPTQYGLWFGLNALTVFVSNMLAARLTFILQLEKIVRAGLLLMMTSCLLMLALNFGQLTVGHFMFPMLSLTVGIGLSMGSATALALKDFQHQAGTATAMLGASQFGLSGLIGVLTAQWSPSPFIIAIPMLCMTLLAIIKKPAPQENNLRSHQPGVE